MKKALAIPLLLIVLQLPAQVQWGIQTGNNLSTPGYTNDLAAFQADALLGYSLGLFGRKIIKEGIRSRFIAPIRYGVLSLDWGLNIVRTGYTYRYASVDNTTGQWLLEFPVLLGFYDKNNALIPRNWKRKGMATYTRFGLKFVRLPKRTVERTTTLEGFRVDEHTTFGGWNTRISWSGGIMQTHKNGNIAALEIAANISLLNTAVGKLQYRELSGKLLNEGYFKNSGSYLSLNLLYLFDSNSSIQPDGKELPPIIYNPRTLDGSK
ncbi:MAG: hypothetical protein R2824_00725 [Saprospiraceae bacterium]|nr:hypothetical protein [Lewinella sp.]